jgi:hypothetical protein
MQTMNTDSRMSRTRINNDLIWKEPSHMQSTLHTLEAHVQAVTTRRLQEALRAEQIRHATANEPRGIPRIITNIRVAVGMSLIAFGERLRSEPAARTRTA